MTSARTRFILEAGRLLGEKYNPAAFAEFYDIIDELYGKAVKRLGYRTLALYGMAVLYLARTDPGKLEEVTKKLVDLLEKSLSKESAKKLSRDRKKLEKELTFYAEKAIGG